MIAEVPGLKPDTRKYLARRGYETVEVREVAAGKVYIRFAGDRSVYGTIFDKKGRPIEWDTASGSPARPE